MKLIAFKNIPPDFRCKEKLLLLLCEFSGIQSFIFGDATTSSTVADIRANSQYVEKLTEKMCHMLQERLGKNYVLSLSSGKVFIAFKQNILPFGKKTTAAEIKTVCDDMQKIIYATTNGQLEMYYACTEVEITDNAELIKLNKKENDALSALSWYVNCNKFHCTNLISVDMDKFFCQDLSRQSLCPVDNKGDIHLGKKYMAIKFDLDNLGSVFQNVLEFDRRKLASEALDRVLKSAFNDTPQVISIFCGGDDIFAITELDCCLDSISRMHKNIENAIYAEPELQLYRNNFGISGGCCTIRGDLGNEPLVYYFHNSEEYLKQAKSVKGKNIMCYNGTNMTWTQVAVLSQTAYANKDLIFKNIDHRQAASLWEEPTILAAKILQLNRTASKKFLNRNEVEILNGIYK